MEEQVKVKVEQDKGLNESNKKIYKDGKSRTVEKQVSVEKGKIYEVTEYAVRGKVVATKCKLKAIKKDGKILKGKNK